MTAERLQSPDRGDQPHVQLPERSLRYLGGLRKEDLRAEQLTEESKKAALTKITLPDQGNLAESLDHSSIQGTSQTTRNETWKNRTDVPEGKEIATWAVEMAGYVKGLDDGTKTILKNRLGIDAEAQGLETAIVDKLYTPYLAGGKADIAEFAKKFLGDASGNVDAAIRELETVRGLLGVFIGGEEKERAKSVDEVEAAVAAHMKALHADRDPENKKRLLAEAREMFGPLVAPAAPGTSGEDVTPLSTDETEPRDGRRLVEEVREDIITETSQEDKSVWTPDRWKEWLKSPEADMHVFDTIYAIRDELERNYETAEGWKEVKAKAGEELSLLPQDVLTKLYDEFAPFIKNLPSGHGEGHFARDLVNLTMLLHDPEAKALYGDSVELTVGMLAGLFHDIGNSVVGRYDDAVRSAGHAEVGAYLFGEMAKDIVPPHILKLVEYSMAAHTHYPKDADKPDKNGKLKRAYAGKDGIVADADGKHRSAIWIARQTDRQDLLQGLPIIVRHIETKAVPTRDYAEGGHHEPEADELADFQFQFTPSNVKKQGDELVHIDPDNIDPYLYKNTAGTPDVLAHVMGLNYSALQNKTDKGAIYIQYDSEYFTNLARTGTVDIRDFIHAVEAKVPPMPPEALTYAFDNFYKMCRIIDPGRDLQSDVVRLFREKFATLSLEDQTHWATGFAVLSTTIWRNWFGRTNGIVTAPIEHDITDSPVTNSLAEDIARRARQVMTAFNPDLLTIPEHQLPSIAAFMELSSVS